VSNKFWSLLFAVVILAEFVLFLIAPFAGWWLPKSISTYGARVDSLFYVILAITGIAFVLTEAILVWNMYRAAADNTGAKSPYEHGNHKLEIIWTLVPAVLLLILAFVQINVWAEIKYPASMKPEKDTVQIEVTARQWEWRIRYPSLRRMKDWEDGTDGSFERFRTIGFEDKGQSDDVHLVNEVHVYQGQKALVWLKTRDVIHSFFLPNIRVKQDALPGKNIPLWFTVDNRNDKNFNCKYNGTTDTWVDGYDPVKGEFQEVGKGGDQFWELACAEFCGARHSLMGGKLYVHEDKKDYLAWLKATEEKFRSGQEPKVQAE
jgi:cytochrome c oxidase subunit II